MARSGLRRWLTRVFTSCLKGKHNEEANIIRVHCVDSSHNKRMASTPLPSINISHVHLQPCAPVINDKSDAQDIILWNKTNLLVNAAAAWQIRRVMPVEVAILDISALAKMTSPKLAQRFKALPILMVLRADNETLCRLSLALLSRDSFARLTLLERRAIHNVLAKRPYGWTEAQLSLYAERERELIAAADAIPSGQHDLLYTGQQTFLYSTYAREPHDWLE